MPSSGLIFECPRRVDYLGSLLRATHQFYARCYGVDHALISIEVVERHAARREARLELPADPTPVELGQPAHIGDGADLVLDDEAGLAVIDNLRNRTAVICDHMRAAGYGLDHDQPERL